MNNIYENIEPFIKEIEHSNNIVIAGHISPDGDAICSSLALAMTIEKMGKTPVVLLEDFGSSYDYIGGKNLIYKEDYNSIENIDLFISADCGDIERLGDARVIFEKAKKTVNIDHHISNDCFASLNIVNPKASSTSEIMFEIINHIGAIDFNIATAIYTGIVFDTGGFKYSCTSKRTHEIAGELIEQGIDTSKIHSTILTMHSLESSRLLAKAINNIYVEDDIIISSLSNEEIKSLDATSKATGAIVPYLLDTKFINIAVFLYEKEDGSIKLSFRSKSIDVNKIANYFGGGGHILASGATLKNISLEQAKEDVLAQVRIANKKEDDK